MWIAASTRDGEEPQVLDAFERLRIRFAALLLVLVPRQPERIDALARLCAQRGFRVARRSARRDGAGHRHPDR